MPAGALTRRARFSDTPGKAVPNVPEAFSFNPLMALAVIFAVGYPAGLLARRIGLPAVTGNILAGVALGQAVTKFELIERTTIARDLETVTIFALSLITLVIGSHLSYRRLHNAKRRIFSVSLFEVVLTIVLVTAGVFLVTGDLEIALLLGAIATATAPATVLAVVREERAKGLLVKTLLATVALDNVFCILLFSVASAWVLRSVGDVEYSALMAVLIPLRDIGLAVVLGSAVGGLLLLLARGRHIEPFSGMFIAILMATGGAQFLDVSPLLANLTLGILLGNAGRESEEMTSSLESLQPILLTCFFTLAGVALDLERLGVIGLLGGTYFLARAIGKIGGGRLGAQFGANLPRVRRNVGMALLPQAGLAIGLVVILQGDARLPEELVAMITNVVLATVIVNELLGPPLVRRAIGRAGEAHKDRRRIVEFLQEEHIMTPLHAEDRSDAIRQLSEFLLRSHGMNKARVDELIESVEERERSFSTAIGFGVALPHARVPEGPEIMGVMGICHEGIDFGAADGQPVHLIIMIATPEEHQELHLEVMGAVTRIMSEPQVRARLFSARDPAEAFDAIETEIQHDYNYFLED